MQQFFNMRRNPGKILDAIARNEIVTLNVFRA